MILILAAELFEIKELCDIKYVEAIPARIEGILSGERAMFVVSGPGVENARAAAEHVLQEETADAIVSIGYVGALDPALAVGGIFLPRRVRRMGESVDYPVETPTFPDAESVAQGTLLTIDRVAQTHEEKRELRETGAAAVDMEAYAVAQEATRSGVPFYCVRVVSDRADEDFPVDFNRARRPDGTFSGWSVAAQAGLRPGRWRRLLDLKHDGDLASRRLAAFLKLCRFA